MCKKKKKAIKTYFLQLQTRPVRSLNLIWLNILSPHIMNIPFSIFQLNFFKRTFSTKSYVQSSIHTEKR